MLSGDGAGVRCDRSLCAVDAPHGPFNRNDGGVRMKMKRLAICLMLLACCLLAGMAAAEEEHIPEPIPAELLPQMIKVTFPAP